MKNNDCNFGITQTQICENSWFEVEDFYMLTAFALVHKTA